jgi:pimeloyl-ACP methyl ester carboxylesterase
MGRAARSGGQTGKFNKEVKIDTMDRINRILVSTLVLVICSTAGGCRLHSVNHLKPVSTTAPAHVPAGSDWRDWFNGIPRDAIYSAGDAGILSTVLSNPSPLRREDYSSNEVVFQLKDGTRVGGLLFKGRCGAPLLISSFGFLADRWSNPSAQMVKGFIEARERLINADVLILDHPTSAGFFELNGGVSMGGYDEGRIIVEVAELLRQSKPAQKICLLGVSMGGNGVVHALLEAKRRQERLFEAAITFSAASRLTIIPGWQLSAFGAPEGQNNPWGQMTGRHKRGIYKMGMSRVIAHFVDIVRQSGPAGFALSDEQVASFFYSNFESRIKLIRTNATPSEFDFSSLERYAYSCSLPQLIEQVNTPLVMVHAADDPSVPYEQFQELAFMGKSNTNICFLGLDHGGHWGFAESMGRQWVADVINKVMGEDVPRRLTKPLRSPKQMGWQEP